MLYVNENLSTVCLIIGIVQKFVFPVLGSSLTATPLCVLLMENIELYNSKHFDELIKEVKDFDLVVSLISDKNQSQKVHRHVASILSELRDLDLIWQRFLKTREESIQIGTKTWHINTQEEFEKNRSLFKEDDELNKKLKVDIKSLFIFSDIFFNKLTLLIGGIIGRQQGIKYESFSSFLKSLRTKAQPNSTEMDLYKDIGEDFEKIDVLLGFYRDKFIIHLNQTYQESLIKSVAYPEINIDFTSYYLDKFDYEKFFDFISKIKDILPEKDKYGNPIFKKSDPRLKIEILFTNLYKIKDTELKQIAEQYIRTVGIRTPDIYYLMKLVKECIIKILDFMKKYIISNCVEINT